MTEQQAHIARQAYCDYGRGSGQPAQLNFGDCFAYALARVTGEPLLFKGDDFRHADIAPAVSSRTPLRGSPHADRSLASRSTPHSPPETMPVQCGREDAAWNEWRSAIAGS